VNPDPAQERSGAIERTSSKLQEDWCSANQARLTAALARVKRVLERHAARAAEARDPVSGLVTRAQQARSALHRGPPLSPGTDGAQRERDDAGAPALDALCAAFGLSSFERDVLLLCAGVELDAAFAPLCAAAQGEPARAFPTFGLALAALAGAHWSALAPGAPLRRWRLVEVAAGPTLTLAALRIDERVLHHIAGLAHMDERLAEILDVLPSPGVAELAPSQAATARRIAAVWSTVPGAQRVAAVQLCGRDRAACRAVACAAAASIGLRAAALSADHVPAAANELENLLRLCEREMGLSGTALLVEQDDPAAGDGRSDAARARNVARLVERIAGPVILWERERATTLRRTAVSFEVARPTRPEQRAAWIAALGPGSADAASVGALVAQFDLELPEIRSCAAEVGVIAAGAGGDDLGRAAWDVCRSRSRSRLDAVAQRIEPLATWRDLVLPPPQLEALRQITAQVRHRATVYERWGFAARSARGLGISALFAGASGCGKTMASEVLANELRLDLYRIDLASVVSKYVGETEKNLRRVFDAAEDGGAILLFDEADALFGKRTEVKDSHDRFANIEVSYLLQRMEAYRGLAVLTTNLKGALDPAFHRRLRFVVQFPFPDAEQRAEIWRRVFPPDAPTEGLDPTKLARLSVPGGAIHNIALDAAFLAAEHDELVGMRHVLLAARRECAKLERPVTDAEIGGWT
jgi:hypothetical protein